MNDRKLFFISGCQRSGTTLLRLVLESHSMVRCFDETEGYKLLKSYEESRLLINQNNMLTGFKIPRFSEQLLSQTMSDIDYGDFPSFYMDEPVLFMVRDYRDVIHSMAKLHYPDGETWLKKYGLKILMHQAKQSTFTEENHHLLASIKESDAPDHLVGALYWKYKTEALFLLIEASKPVLPVSYESFVASPREELLKVLEILNLSWENSLLEHSKHRHSELDEDGLAIGGTDPKLAIHNNSIQSHKNFFSTQELEDIRQVVGKTLIDLETLKIGFT